MFENYVMSERFGFELACATKTSDSLQYDECCHGFLVCEVYVIMAVLPTAQ